MGGIYLILFLIWFYVSYRKAAIDSIQPLSYKPILALFCFVIPLFNLFAPYKIMNEIWTVRNRDLPREMEGRKLIKLWWFISIVLFVYSRYGSYKMEHADSLTDYLTIMYLSALSLLVSIHYFYTVLKLTSLIEGQPNC